MSSALLVNKGRGGGKSRRHNKAAPAKVVPLRDLFAAVGGLKHNPLVTNPLVANPLVANRGRGRGRARTNSGGMSNKSRAKMSLLAQIRPRNRAGHFLPLRANAGKRTRNRHYPNPLVANRGRGRRSYNNPLVTNRGRRGRRSYNNPLVANRGRSRHNAGRGMMRHNPFDSAVGPFARALNAIPVIGPFLGATVLALAGSASGALATVPIFYGLKAASKYVPEAVKPFAFSLAGAMLSGIVRLAFRNSALGTQAAVALAASGGAVDAYRKLIGQSSNLGDGYMDEYGGEGDWGDGDDMGEYGAEGEMGDDYGDDGYGDDPNVRPGEWADASLMDAQYSDGDLSAEEIQFAELGRRAFRKRFHRKPKRAAAMRRRRQQQQGETDEMTSDDVEQLEDDNFAGAKHPKASAHAGRPGRRWAWLIYWVGPAQFAQLAKLDANRRRRIIQDARHAAMKVVQKALSTGVTDGDTRVEAMEAAGLLAAA